MIRGVGQFCSLWRPMETAPIITGLWDYGWLRHDSVELTPVISDLLLIEQYIASHEFCASFLPIVKYETGIHGPFVADSIHAEDFIPLQRADLEHYLDSIELSETPDDDVIERVKMLHHLGNAFDGGRKCFILKYDERDKALFHEWGFVLCIFREFLFTDSQRGRLERFIVGYD